MKIASFDIGEINMSYAVFSVEKDNKNIETVTLDAWDMLPLREKIKNNKKTNKCDMLAMMILKLSTDLNRDKKIFENVETVLVESQNEKSPRLFALSACIHCFFYCNFSNISCRFFHPKNKLGFVPQWMKGVRAKALRKKLAILRCQYFVENSSIEKNFVDLFSNKQKQDDLADCLLQGFSEYCPNLLKSINQQVPAEDCLKKTIMRKPSNRIKNYSPANLKWCFANIKNPEKDMKIIKACNKYHGSIQAGVKYWSEILTMA